MWCSEEREGYQPGFSWYMMVLKSMRHLGESRETKKGGPGQDLRTPVLINGREGRGHGSQHYTNQLCDLGGGGQQNYNPHLFL